MTPWLALDIGGANIKCADGLGYAHSEPFPLWRAHQQLATRLRGIIAAAPPCAGLAVTMTGELADCFATKQQGVQYILDAVEEAAAERSVRVYLVLGAWATVGQAAADPLRVASANWHALAWYCARYSQTRAALLLDIGSTTVDIIPLLDGRVVARGATDLQRIQHGELVYTGVQRSPVCALTHTLPYRDQLCSVAQELFATTRDVYLLLGDEVEAPADCDTADAQPATRDAAHRRLSRMLCANQDDIPLDTAVAWAEHIAQAQLLLVAQCLQQVRQQFESVDTSVVVSGQGDFLARRLLHHLHWTGPVVYLNQQLSGPVSRCASAHALAVLAGEDQPHRQPH